jgi:hypothetical protein
MAQACIMKVGYDRTHWPCGNVGAVLYGESAQNFDVRVPAPRILAREHAEQIRDRDAPPGGER